MPQHFSHSDGGIKLTATGIVPDFHGIQLHVDDDSDIDVVGKVRN